MWKVIDEKEINNIKQNKIDSIRLLWRDNDYAPLPPPDPQPPYRRSIPVENNRPPRVQAVLVRSVAEALRSSTSVTSVDLPERNLLSSGVGVHGRNTQEENASYLALFDAVMANPNVRLMAVDTTDFVDMDSWNAPGVNIATLLRRQRETSRLVASLTMDTATREGCMVKIKRAAEAHVEKLILSGQKSSFFVNGYELAIPLMQTCALRLRELDLGCPVSDTVFDALIDTLEGADTRLEKLRLDISVLETGQTGLLRLAESVGRNSMRRLRSLTVGLTDEARSKDEVDFESTFWLRLARGLGSNITLVEVVVKENTWQSPFVRSAFAVALGRNQTLRRFELRAFNTTDSPMIDPDYRFINMVAHTLTSSRSGLVRLSVPICAPEEVAILAEALNNNINLEELKLTLVGEANTEPRAPGVSYLSQLVLGHHLCDLEISQMDHTAAELRKDDLFEKMREHFFLGDLAVRYSSKALRDYDASDVPWLLKRNRDYRQRALSAVELLVVSRETGLSTGPQSLVRGFLGVASANANARAHDENLQSEICDFVRTSLSAHVDYIGARQLYIDYVGFLHRREWRALSLSPKEEGQSRAAKPKADHDQEAEEVGGLDDLEAKKDPMCEIVYGPKNSTRSIILPGAAVRLSGVLSAYLSRWRHDGRTRPYEVDEHFDKDVVALALHYLALQNGKEPSRIVQPLTSSWLRHAQGCSPEDAKFIDDIWAGAGGKYMVYELIEVADFLRIEGLLRLGCAKVASVLRDVLSPADIEPVLRDVKYGPRHLSGLASMLTEQRDLARHVDFGNQAQRSLLGVDPEQVQTPPPKRKKWTECYRRTCSRYRRIHRNE